MLVSYHAEDYQRVVIPKTQETMKKDYCLQWKEPGTNRRWYTAFLWDAEWSDKEEGPVRPFGTKLECQQERDQRIEQEMHRPENMRIVEYSKRNEP
jgi:hypothetical protein